MACAGRASSEGKFGTAAAENGLLLQGEWAMTDKTVKKQYARTEPREKIELRAESEL
jgi:hypothetical protein